MRDPVPTRPPDRPASPAGARPTIGLVLSGGGARGAYEAGVIRYIREHLRAEARFDVITGSSVGALNGAYVAATADRPRAQGRMLARLWSELRVDDIYRFGWAQLRTLPQTLFGRNLPRTTSHGSSLGGLIDARALDGLIRTRIPWAGITDNLYRGHLQAFACSATELATGTNTVFVQTRSGKLPSRWPEEFGQTVAITPITAAHVLASAALPVLFPAVRVGDQIYVDGSLRQNTPLRPAMRLGADRLLVISLRFESEFGEFMARSREEARTVYPNAMFMLGKLLNGLMLDKLDADLARIERVNRMIAAGTALYGEPFAAELARAMNGPDAEPYRPVHTLLIQPSEDLARLAFEAIRKTGLSHYSGVMARWLRRAVLATPETTESDLASYILFDPAYTGPLMDLGFEDARRRHAELADFFA
jgi:NTE family protein